MATTRARESLYSDSPPSRLAEQRREAVYAANTNVAVESAPARAGSTGRSDRDIVAEVNELAAKERAIREAAITKIRAQRKARRIVELVRLFKGANKEPDPYSAADKIVPKLTPDECVELARVGIAMALLVAQRNQFGLDGEPIQFGPMMAEVLPKLGK